MVVDDRTSLNDFLTVISSVSVANRNMVKLMIKDRVANVRAWGFSFWMIAL